MICEPFDIVFNGLYSIISDIDFHTEILRHKPELYFVDETNKFNPDLIIIDPVLNLTDTSIISSITQDFLNISSIAVTSIYNNSNLTKLFRYSFSIGDSAQAIGEIISKVISDLTEPSMLNNSSLSERELDVLKLIALGMSNKEIADKLFISIHTVISHRKNITQKLGIKSVAGLVTYVTVNKILDINTLESLQQ